MTTIKEPRRVIGDAKCGMCGKPVKVRISSKNKLYANCIEAQGGCGAQFFSRSAVADKLMARSIEKWMDPNERRAYLGEEALPAKARPLPQETLQPPPPPQSEPEPEEPDAETDTDPQFEPIQTQPAPSTQTRRTNSAPRSKRPVPPQFTKPKSKDWWDL